MSEFLRFSCINIRYLNPVMIKSTCSPRPDEVTRTAMIKADDPFICEENCRTHLSMFNKEEKKKPGDFDLLKYLGKDMFVAANKVPIHTLTHSHYLKLYYIETICYMN